MDTVARLSHALDEFAGICAVGDLNSAAIETTTAHDALALKVSGSVWWDSVEHPITMWAGASESAPDSPEDDSVWLRVGDKTVDLSEVDERSGVFDQVPADAVRAVAAGVKQLLAMLTVGTEAIKCAETQRGVEAILGQLQLAAGAVKHAVHYGAAAAKAQLDLLMECAVDLLGNMSVTESEDIHLAFDVSADTLDPATGKPVRMRVCWAAPDEASQDYAHAFELAGVKCQGHDEADFDRLLAAYPESSREHYRHAFTHLHQAAHAIGEYAGGRVGQALADEGTVEDPLLHVERHEIALSVHAEVAAELDAFVKEMAGRPSRGDEHEDHQHQH